MTPTLTPDPSMDAQRIIDILNEPLPEKKRQSLPCEQKKVIQAGLEPLLVVAGAGAGKTETMSKRVLWLVAHEGIEPRNILGLTFTRKAAGELGERLVERLTRLGEVVPGIDLTNPPTSLTYNAFAARLVTEYGMRIGIDPDARLLGQSHAVQMMTQIVESWSGDLDRSKALGTHVQRALALAGTISEHDHDIDSAREGLSAFTDTLEAWSANEPGECPGGDLGKLWTANKERERTLDLVAAYAARKQAEGLLDFGDQVRLATRIARECPDVVSAVREEYRAVLLDEFQDTSVLQMELLSTLFHDHPVTAVGDPNQAIYGWRGASAASLDSFHTRFRSDLAELAREAVRSRADGVATKAGAGGDGRSQEATPQERAFTARKNEVEEAWILQLSTSWRNDHEILAVANAVAPTRAHRAPLGLAADHLAGDGKSGAGPVTLTAGSNAERGRVEVAHVRTREDQLDMLVRFLVKERQERMRRSGGRQSVTAAVLCRKRSYFTDVERALREHGIPTEVIGVGGLLDQPAVADLRAALELSVDVRQAPWLMRLFHGVAVGSADLVLLHRLASRMARERASSEGVDHPEVLLLDAVDALDGTTSQGALSPEATRRLQVLAQRLRAIRAGAGRSVTAQVERAITILGLTEDVLADPLGNSGRAALDAFVDTAAQWEDETPGGTMREFLVWLAVAEEAERGLPAAVSTAGATTDAVQILTVHAAKGLEWDVVAVIGMDDGVFPEHGTRSAKRTDTRTPGSSSEWLTDVSALPAPMRGDHEYLPTFDLTGAGGGRTLQASANRWIATHKLALSAYHELEERRLAYVAVTRAKHRLLLLSSWFDGAATVRLPSRFLTEAHEKLRELTSLPADASAPIVRTPGKDGDDEDRPWKDPGERLIAVDTAISDPPEEGEVPETPDALYPPAEQRSRRLMQAAAERVHAAVSSLDASAVSPRAALADLAGDPLVDEALVLLDERQAARERTELAVAVDTLPATSVERLVEDPDGFALDLRRPMPQPPSRGASLGTLFHAWVEERLGRAAVDADERAETETAAALAALDAEERRRFDRLVENFESLDLPGEAIALESPFALELGELSVQGRIDAVFRDEDGQVTIVDWKTGRGPGRGADAALIARYRVQLELYRLAWARATGEDEARIRAVLVFLGGAEIVDLADLERADGTGDGDGHAVNARPTLEERVRAALGAGEEVLGG